MNMNKIVVFALAALLLITGTSCRHSPGLNTPHTLRIMSYNIHHGRGMDGVVDLERIAALIREAEVDLVALQEVDKGTRRTDQIEIAAELARLTDMNFAFEKNIDFQGGEYGNAILSRHLITNSQNHHYKMLREGEQRGLLSVDVSIHNRTITFASTHLDHRPDPSERLSNVIEIKAFMAGHTTPVILAGDFNDQPGRAVHSEITTIFTDAWEEAGLGDGFTYSSTDPKSRIDYVFLSPKSAWRVTSAIVVESEASDHLPLLVEVTLND